MPTDLWLVSEGSAIGATYHDLSSINPDLLVQKGIVPSSWQCTRYRRTRTQVDIHYQQANWRMRERHLWINVPHEKPWESPFDPDYLIINLTEQYLRAHPFLANPDIWFNWKLAANFPEPEEWLRKNFLLRRMPAGFEQEKIRPVLSWEKEDWLINLELDVEEKSLGDQPATEMLSLNCSLTPIYSLDHGELLSELVHWPMFREIVGGIMQFLLEGD